MPAVGGAGAAGAADVGNRGDAAENGAEARPRHGGMVVEVVEAAIESAEIPSLEPH